MKIFKAIGGIVLAGGIVAAGALVRENAVVQPRSLVPSLAITRLTRRHNSIPSKPCATNDPNESMKDQDKHNLVFSSERKSDEKNISIHLVDLCTDPDRL